MLELDVNTPDDLARAGRRAGRALGPPRRRPARDRLRARGRARRPVPRHAGGERAASRSRPARSASRRCAVALLPLMQRAPRGAGVVGLDFDATVAWPVYDWMGVAKAGARGGLPLPRPRPRPARRAREPRERRADQDGRGRRDPRLRDARRLVGGGRPARLGRRATPRPSRRLRASCSATARARSPARSCTSTAATTRWAPRARAHRRPPGSLPLPVPRRSRKWGPPVDTRALDPGHRA